MGTSATSAETAVTGEFTVAHITQAPLEKVWRAWTEPARLAKWWGPKGFSWIQGTLELRPGGMFHYGMRAPNGLEMWGKFVFREILPMSRLVFVVSFSDKEGGTARHFASATWPLEVLNTVTFTETGGKTTLELRGIPVNASDVERETFAGAFDGMRAGFKGTLDQLDEYLASS